MIVINFDIKYNKIILWSKYMEIVNVKAYTLMIFKISQVPAFSVGRLGQSPWALKYSFWLLFQVPPFLTRHVQCPCLMSG